MCQPSNIIAMADYTKKIGDNVDKNIYFKDSIVHLTNSNGQYYYDLSQKISGTYTIEANSNSSETWLEGFISMDKLNE